MTCKTCEEQRRKLKEAWSQKDLIKAAALAMEGAKMIVKGGKNAHLGETSGDGLDKA